MQGVLLVTLVPLYNGPMSRRTAPPVDRPVTVTRTQTGVRIEKRILKVLKAVAEYHDLTLGDLIEGIVLHAFEGKAPFSAKTLDRIKELKRIYGLDLDARHSHKLIEAGES